MARPSLKMLVCVSESLYSKKYMASRKEQAFVAFLPAIHRKCSSHESFNVRYIMNNMEKLPQGYD